MGQLIAQGYVVIGALYALYFNIELMFRDFWAWLLFGEVICTLKGIIWPYYALTLNII